MGDLHGALAGGLGIVGLLASFWTGSGRTNSLIALIAGGGIGAYLASIVLAAAGLPPIHDITTDRADPPQFVKVVEIRGSESNPLNYTDKQAPIAFGSNETKLVSELQSEAFPQIQTLHIDRSLDEVMNLAEDLVKSRGWDLIAVSADKGLIEATEKTAWFGFKDDVVIRVRASDDGGSIVDMRSVSRVGMSDLGVNAARIGAFLRDLEAAAG